MPEQYKIFKWPPHGGRPGPGAHLSRVLEHDMFELLRFREFTARWGPTATRGFYKLTLEAHQSSGPLAIFSFISAAPMALVVVQLSDMRVSIYTRARGDISVGQLEEVNARRVVWALGEIGLPVPERWRTDIDPGIWILHIPSNTLMERFGPATGNRARACAIRAHAALEHHPAGSIVVELHSTLMDWTKIEPPGGSPGQMSLPLGDHKGELDRSWWPLPAQQLVPGDLSSWRLLGVPVPLLLPDSEFVKWLDSATN